MTTVHLAEYCSCKYESGFSVLSIHKSKRGAFKAMLAHRWADLQEVQRPNRYHKKTKGECYQWMQLWRISSMEIFE